MQVATSPENFLITKATRLFTVGWLCATAARQTEIDNLLLIIKFYQPIYFVEYFCRTANIYNTDSCQSTFYKAYLACC